MTDAELSQSESVTDDAGYVPDGYERLRGLLATMSDQPATDLLDDGRNPIPALVAAIDAIRAQALTEMRASLWEELRVRGRDQAAEVEQLRAELAAANATPPMEDPFVALTKDLYQALLDDLADVKRRYAWSEQQLANARGAVARIARSAETAEITVAKLRAELDEVKARIDGSEVSVWVTAPGGVNVTTWPDGGDWETASAYAAESEARGTPAVVMIRDVLKTSWRKMLDSDHEDAPGVES